MERPLVSIIMPVHNAGPFLAEAIGSVIRQSHDEWELIIINDGSTDNSKEILERVDDPRIRVYSQSKQGPASARNIGLQHMKGRYFCFLDADDVLPEDSLLKRLQRFSTNKNVAFVDGSVSFFDHETKREVRRYTPAFHGNPLSGLVRLDGRNFAGLSWMIRRIDGYNYRMDEHLTHGEDLLFFMRIAREGGVYDYVPDLVLLYRQHRRSAMRDIVGLERGYLEIYSIIKSWSQIRLYDRFSFKLKTKKIMVLEYLKHGMFKQSFLSIFK